MMFLEIAISRAAAAHVKHGRRELVLICNEFMNNNVAS